MRRQCAFRMTNGEACRAAPLHDSQFCWAHSPEHAQEAQEARRLGGLRRKRETTLIGAYDFNGLDTVQGIRRVLEIALLDTLAMENSIARNRTLAYLAMAALRSLEVGNLEDRIASLELAVQSHPTLDDPSPFDAEFESLSENDKEKP